MIVSSKTVTLGAGLLIECGRSAQARTRPGAPPT